LTLARGPSYATNLSHWYQPLAPPKARNPPAHRKAIDPRARDRVLLVLVLVLENVSQGMVEDEGENENENKDEEDKEPVARCAP
jgi:hypothetical protein